MYKRQVYYYHDRMLNGSAEERAFLANVFQLEFALMYAAHWWHMAARGGIGVVLPRRTINYLIRVLGDIPIDPDRPYGPRGQTTFPYIARRMHEVRDAAERYGNTVTHHEYGNLPSYQIVWTTMTGYVDYERPTGRRLFMLRRDMREWAFRDLPLTGSPS